MNLLAYNLIRGVAAEAAQRSRPPMQPRVELQWGAADGSCL